MQMCTDLFGMSFDEIRANIAYTESYYGGQKNYTVGSTHTKPVIHIQGTNVVIMNGGQDPWQVLGVYKPEWARPGQQIVFMEVMKR